MIDTLSSGVTKYLGYLGNVRRYSPHTVRAYAGDLRDFVAFLKQRNLPGATLMRSFYPVVRDYLFRLKASQLKNRSIARKLSAVRSYLAYLSREGLLPDEFELDVQGFKIDRDLPRYLTEGEAETLMDLPQGDDFQAYRDRAVLELFYQSGVRLSELTFLTDQQIDLNGQLLRVLGKGRKMRVVPFGEIATARLQQYIEVRDQLFGKGSPTLFVNRSGRQITTRSIARIVEKYSARLREGQKLSPHTLRHSFATHLMDNGADLLAVSDLLGHESIKTTQIYTHLTTSTLKKEYLQAHPRAQKKALQAAHTGKNRHRGATTGEDNV